MAFKQLWRVFYFYYSLDIFLHLQHYNILISLVAIFKSKYQGILNQNYPNPFNPITVIHYQLPVDCKVTLKVFNILGQEVVTLVDEFQDAGYKLIEWNARNYPSGIYYVKMNADVFRDVKKVVLVK